VALSSCTVNASNKVLNRLIHLIFTHMEAFFILSFVLYNIHLGHSPLFIRGGERGEKAVTVITRPKTQSLAGSDREVMTLMSAVSTVLPNLDIIFRPFRQLTSATGENIQPRSISKFVLCLVTRRATSFDEKYF
jgi:hypothetical protein